ncbi:hypothetical protein CspeluHIS016_0501380 [Cutaneotrichosporon spelunceum]|uniref:Uncharacterized protein n=1 Tax=Cutaneotrichosporon spelunceum TaxID=1672016 RepID=A0AAD3TWE7_9TREE|nr:hypothetical protein CspeluHIS016_0501380 [Cutaneotrichosporon spelunceum]
MPPPKRRATTECLGSLDYSDIKSGESDYDTETEAVPSLRKVQATSKAKAKLTRPAIKCQQTPRGTSMTQRSARENDMRGQQIDLRISQFRAGRIYCRHPLHPLYDHRTHFSPDAYASMRLARNGVDAVGPVAEKLMWDGFSDMEKRMVAAQKDRDLVKACRLMWLIFYTDFAAAIRPLALHCQRCAAIGYPCMVVNNRNTEQCLGCYISKGKCVCAAEGKLEYISPTPWADFRLFVHRALGFTGLGDHLGHIHWEANLPPVPQTNPLIALIAKKKAKYVATQAGREAHKSETPVGAAETFTPKLELERTPVDELEAMYGGSVVETEDDSVSDDSDSDESQDESMDVDESDDEAMGIDELARSRDRTPRICNPPPARTDPALRTAEAVTRALLAGHLGLGGPAYAAAWETVRPHVLDLSRELKLQTDTKHYPPPHLFAARNALEAPFLQHLLEARSITAWPAIKALWDGAYRPSEIGPLARRLARAVIPGPPLRCGFSTESYCTPVAGGTVAVLGTGGIWGTLLLQGTSVKVFATGAWESKFSRARIISFAKALGYSARSVACAHKVPDTQGTAFAMWAFEQLAANCAWKARGVHQAFLGSVGRRHALVLVRDQDIALALAKRMVGDAGLVEELVRRAGLV